MGSGAGAHRRGGGAILTTGASILASLLAALAVSAAPSDPRRVAIVYPPWWSAARSVAAATSAGKVLDLGGAPFIVIVRREVGTQIAGVQPPGALLVLGADPRSLCSSAVRDVT